MLTERSWFLDPQSSTKKQSYVVWWKQNFQIFKLLVSRNPTLVIDQFKQGIKA